LPDADYAGRSHICLQMLTTYIDSKIMSTPYQSLYIIAFTRFVFQSLLRKCSDEASAV
jgi:hypothetical protein